MAQAGPCRHLHSVQCFTAPLKRSFRSRAGYQSRRHLQHDARQQHQAPPFAFAFDIDGVLLRSAKPIPGAREALEYLQRYRIPFILLTNGGGKHERTRVADISKSLRLQLHESNFIQSHTPFAELVHGSDDQAALQDKCILVMGGEGDRCREVAESYGYRNVLSPGDIFRADQTIWPFSSPFSSYYASHARPLPLPIYPGTHATRKPLHEHLRVYAMFVYNDPRDWGLDTSLIVDLLLSHRGYLGTLSGLNGRSDLPNCGYQQDGQPALWFSNPDLWWAADHHLNRLGQGAFHAALRGVWHSVTDGKAPLLANVCGKPHQPTYAFAESRLVGETKSLWGDAHQPLQRVYMIGDNPMSDIMGANRFESLLGSRWSSVLVRTGVYQGGEPTEKPTAVVQDVWEAVRWALAKEGWSDVQDEAPVESSAGVA